MMSDKENNRIIVIGAGAGGMMAAGRAAEKGADVLLLEKMDQPGKKILISGKTRCNLTNASELEDFIMAYGSNGRFLYSAFQRFFREDLLAFLKSHGVETKTERGGRIFPASDDARDIVRAFECYLADGGVQIITGVRVTGIEVKDGKVTGVRTEAVKKAFTSGESSIPAKAMSSLDPFPTGDGIREGWEKRRLDSVFQRNGLDRANYSAAAVVLAAGGASFPATGSTGDGYRLAESLGHTIVKLRPALVPLVVEEVELARNMQGVSLRNVTLTGYRCRTQEIDSLPFKKTVIGHRMGEMMFTHFGIGGPITLLMSLEIVKALEKGPVSVAIDLKPALDIKQLQKRLQRDFDQFSKRSFRHILKDLLPQKMIEPIMQLSGIPGDKPGNQINAEERDHLADLLKSLRFNIKGPLPLSSAMVTAGGVSLKEIDPRNMASRLYKGLYFCGEVMDIDADTGGYNLQAAFSTGYIAGESAAEFVLKS